MSAHHKALRRWSPTCVELGQDIAWRGRVSLRALDGEHQVHELHRWRPDERHRARPTLTFRRTCAHLLFFGQEQYPVIPGSITKRLGFLLITFFLVFKTSIR